jgi:predicted DNA-binding transcriptional regulator AlpA
MAKTDRIPDAWPALMTDVTAAGFLDMSVSQFRALVEAGHLPKGRKICGTSMVRWRREQLLAWINLEFGLPAKNSRVSSPIEDDEDEWESAIRAA